MDTREGTVIAKGLVERIGFDDAVYTCTTGNGHKTRTVTAVPDHTKAMGLVLDGLVAGETAVLNDLSAIKAVGHRFVNGGPIFSDPVITDDKVLEDIHTILDIAPLHNPAHLLGIEACITAMPDTPQVIVFDTGFHATVPEYAHMYALPGEYYEKYGIRRYGFHGTSHYYVSHRAAELHGRVGDPTFKVVTCHLGNGGSVDAVLGGKAVETSMGFTPLEGLIMGTRTGDLDSSVPLYIMRKEGLTPEEMDTVINKKSGLLGVTGLSSDMREVEEAANNGNPKAILAIDMYCYRIKKYIAAYTGILGGCDVLVFTAGVGEHSPRVRAKSVNGLDFLGFSLDSDRNKSAIGGESVISKDGSAVKIHVIPTNEEIVIAREAERMVKA